MSYLNVISDFRADFNVNDCMVSFLINMLLDEIFFESTRTTSTVVLVLEQ